MVVVVGGRMMGAKRKWILMEGLSLLEDFYHSKI